MSVLSSPTGMHSNIMEMELLDDYFMEDTLLMEKATLLLQETVDCIETTTSNNSKSMGKTCSSSSIGNSSSSSTTNSQRKRKSKSLKRKSKPKKSVHFASISALTEVDYLEPRDSEELIESLYYTEDEMQMFLHQLHCDVADYDSLDTSCPSQSDSDTFSSRGLERRTKKGQAQRTRWRKLCRTMVLDEQDRQWAILPMDEPVDAKRVAFVSLEVTHKAKQLARKLAIQDEREVLGDSSTTSPLNDSLTSISLSCSGSDTNAPLNTHTHVRKNNSKGHSVHFPRHMVHQVYEYEHASTEQEKETLWHPYLQLDEAKQRFASQIAQLENQDEAINSATSSIHSMEDSSNNEEEECWRGLEPRTIKAEAAQAALQAQVYKTLRFQQVYDEASLAKRCQKLSAKSRKQARSRGLMDQRAVKAYLYQQQQKLVTRVPKATTRAMVVTPPPPSAKRTPPSSPSMNMKTKKNMTPTAATIGRSSHHGTVKRTSSFTSKEDKEEAPVSSFEPILKGEDMEDDCCCLPTTKLLRHTSEGTVMTMDSTFAPSFSSSFSSTLLPSPEWNVKPTRRSLPNILSPPSLQKADLVDSPPRRHSSVFVYPPLDEEEDGEEEEEVAEIPTAVLISIPDKYFNDRTKDDSIIIPENHAEKEAGVVNTLDWSMMEEEDESDGSGRLSGIIERLWEKRRSQGKVHSFEQCEVIAAGTAN